MTIVKEVISDIVVPLACICNLSFQLGCFPDKMKTAKVIPLFKAGDKKLYTNYRPLSLLSQFSKILEKLFVARLDCFVEKHNKGVAVAQSVGDLGWEPERCWFKSQYGPKYRVWIGSWRDASSPPGHCQVLLSKAPYPPNCSGRWSSTGSPLTLTSLHLCMNRS